MEASRSVDSRFVGLAALSGAAGGVVMAMWMMIYSAATGNGFWTPLNVCMASFIYRSDGEMMVKEAMMHPGMAMDAPVNGSHLAVGFVVHMGFSIVVGVAFALVLGRDTQRGVHHRAHPLRGNIRPGRLRLAATETHRYEPPSSASLIGTRHDSASVQARPSSTASGVKIHGGIARIPRACHSF